MDIFIIDDAFEDAQIIEILLRESYPHAGIERYNKAAQAVIAMFPENEEEGYNLPDVVIIDIKMPVINGVDAINVLRKEEKTNELPIIAVSSCPRQKTREEALNAGADSFCVKTGDIDQYQAELCRQIESATRKRAIQS